MGKWNWGQIVTPAIYILLIAILAVFGHSGLQGAHGLTALNRAQALEVDLQAELVTASAERLMRKNLVDRLSLDHLDLDLLDERARSVLGYTSREELIIR